MRLPWCWGATSAEIASAWPCDGLVKLPGQRSSRLAVRLDTGGTAPDDRLERRLLAWGDLVTLRNQLLTLKELAGRHASG